MLGPANMEVLTESRLRDRTQGKVRPRTSACDFDGSDRELTFQTTGSRRYNFHPAVFSLLSNHVQNYFTPLVRSRQWLQRDLLASRPLYSEIH